MNVLARIGAKMYSGTAMVRTPANQIGMLNSGKLSLPRIIKYALQVNWGTCEKASFPVTTKLQKKALEWVIAHTEIHEKAIPIIAKYLDSFIFVVPTHNSFIHKRPIKTYPARNTAQWLLDRIANTTPSLGRRIGKILDKAPPVDVYL